VRSPGAPVPYFSRSIFPTVHAFLDRLDVYLGKLPPDFRYAVEVRNETWFEPALIEVLRHRRTALVLVEHGRLPHPADLAGSLDLVTTDFAYARLIGDRKAVDARTKTFDRLVLDQGASLARWAELLHGIASSVEKVYAFANNHYAGHGPATIRDLAARVAAREPPRPDSV
jgi:uncharacterized protein YecE (DUF72 family)